MTKRRDCDIMAIDHALRAIRTSSPGMLKANIEMVIFLMQQMLKEKKS